MIGIIDYGMGNLHSVKNACDHLGLDAIVSNDKAVLEQCDRLILPGVGAIKDCMDTLNRSGLAAWIKTQVQQKQIPILGICLGMQALFESSEENGGVPCFGFLNGKVVFMSKTDVRVPHIGWNALEWNETGGFALVEPSYVYYDHSYYGVGLDPEDLMAYSRYGSYLVPGVVKKGNVVGTQFHPEKSGKAGLSILDAFGRGIL
ncbi:imidazole glycerol phosphate synthase subunit HisH [uncultured Dubosiella sp.]|uniref:imidazole glycerol phosphate synthase subunit HisH n=1 Tax=uncultured Dubosiella sp. TaxID=1937011 RepID=UPI00272F8D49|nr:imidazole glycerol phosphate synthase subunit HisH [uncultured Dubosiella sp.]